MVRDGVGGGWSVMGWGRGRSVMGRGRVRDGAGKDGRGDVR